MTAAQRLAGYGDLLALAEGTRAEVLDGQLVMSPSPLPRHARVQGSLARFVGGPFDFDGQSGGPGGWWILVEVDICLGPHDIVRPDLAGWRRERLLEPWDERPIRVVPDWICEVLSPSNQAQDRVHKRRLYARHGVQHFWLADPAARTLEAFELRDGAWSDAGCFEGTGPVRIPPFDAVEVPLDVVFAPVEKGT